MERTGSTTTAFGGKRTGLRGRATLLALLAAGALGLTGPSAAHALELSELKAEPAASGSTAAGANSDFELNVAFDSEDVENIRIGLPPGMVGNPTATPVCTQEQLHASTPACPAESQVGSTTVNATVTLIAVPVTLDIQGKLYNLEPNPGEPARFGIVLTPVDPLPLLPVVLESAVELRSTDFGLDTVIEDIPNTTSGLPTHINSMSVTLFGNPPGGTKPFTRNPTSCNEAVTHFTADDYATDTPATGTASFTPTACDQLDFSPEFSASIGAPGLTADGAKPPVNSLIEQDFTEAGLSRARVILPSQILSDLDALSDQCPVASFQAGTCPSNTAVGSAVAGSELLTEPLTGPVVIVENPGSLPRIGLDLTGPMHLQLYGDLVIAGAGSGIEFAGLPDIPIAEFALSFQANDLVQNAGNLCDGVPRTFTTEFEGHNGASSNGTKAATIEGCTAGGPATPPSGKKAKKCKKKRRGGKKSDAAAAAKKKKKCKRKRRRK